jgi:hypothetical protein
MAKSLIQKLMAAFLPRRWVDAMETARISPENLSPTNQHTP